MNNALTRGLYSHFPAVLKKLCATEASSERQFASFETLPSFALIYNVNFTFARLYDLSAVNDHFGS